MHLQHTYLDQQHPEHTYLGPQHPEHTTYLGQQHPEQAVVCVYWAAVRLALVEDQCQDDVLGEDDHIRRRVLGGLREDKRLSTNVQYVHVYLTAL